ncbi:MAG TPA: hypothetical protein VNU68_17205 [Verrucomicrobiae bacterium]|nr:hypothetical protein [Verrucomicrobiae bacterium]
MSAIAATAAVTTLAEEPDAAIPTRSAIASKSSTVACDQAKGLPLAFFP